MRAVRSRTIYDSKGERIVEIVNGEVVYSRDELAERVLTHHVMPDIAPYRSMIDGSVIDSRAKHQEHLHRNGCQEIGNDTSYFKPRPTPDVDPQGRRELIALQIKGMGHDNFKRALSREIEHIKWNSRGLPRS